ncbi:MAG: hypothetical protein R8K20_05995 [Gallionellaceae bacterium]
MAAVLKPDVKSFLVSYKEPETQTSSRLRTITDSTIRLFPDRKCEDLNAPGGGVVNSRVGGFNDETHNDKEIGIPKASTIRNSSEVYLKPNTPIAIVYQVAGMSGTQQYICGISAYFVPEENADYQVLTSHTEKKCFAFLTKVIATDSSSQVIYVPVKLNKSESCK